MRFIFSSVLAAVSLLPSIASSIVVGPQPGTFSNVTVFTPPSNYTIPRTLYARTLLLNQNCEYDNVLLATWENYSPEPPYFPIFRSTDLGRTWTEYSRVTDQVNGWGLRYQPFLYELPSKIGSFPAGTVLLSGNSIPADLSQTQIELYASLDKGKTWKFVSHIAHGGRAIPNNGETPVWEPFLMMWQGKMIVYYSDQRDAKHGQKLVHQISNDLLTWEDPVDDVAYSTYDDRPGMTTVAEMTFGQYIMTYEFWGAPEAGFAVYYRISQDPTNFNASVGYPLIATDGTVPVSSPYIVWSPAGGSLGTLVVSSGSGPEVYLNHNLGAPGAWTKVNTPESTSYTRSLRVMPGESNILIVGGGILSGPNNSVTATTIDITPISPSLAKCGGL
ncbi:glycoside hydrolase family 93 protein [Lepidopterella palustris CBS 459.81]|uniref:Glycoside hydrolase family 93 protein n=1 Tax=Lepidopterella palustris CBS 459.81 TaxID=1314670 RepID=A0A8E2EFZ3_9PEZI|nr:glycoside hydrolase family 93 protein [Lepidopterella palustris CBS 459.81]